MRLRVIFLSKILFLPALMSFGCSTSIHADEEYLQDQQDISLIYYDYSDESFPNPERGFYKFLEQKNSEMQVWYAPSLIKLRTEDHINLVYCSFVLDGLHKSDIGEAYLKTMTRNLAAIRESGIKCILRFSYTYPASIPKRPYGDAALNQIQRHLDQLASIIQNNSDVIFVWQAGFIGAWGEWHYTDHFVDDPADLDTISPAQHIRRMSVTSRLLNILPSDLQVQIRYPLAKKKMLNNVTPLSSKFAFKNTPEARLSHHNDCFLATNNDQNTYKDPSDRSYLTQETKFLAMGGESCENNPPRTDCNNAQKELNKYHFTYLNSGYHPSVLAVWDAQSCLSDIRKQLGYRIALKSGYFNSNVSSGDTLLLDLRLKNHGYAAPVNPRPVKLILRGEAGVYKADLKTDIRLWAGGEDHRMRHRIYVPNCVPEGDYSLSLMLPDRSPNLVSSPEYSIRLANKGLWDADTGENALNMNIRITAFQGNHLASSTGSFQCHE